MFSKLEFLFLFVLVVLSSSGHGYFFRRWESTPSPSFKSDKLQIGQAHGLNDVKRYQNNNWFRPIPPPALPLQSESVLPPLAAAIPFPVAIQLPHQILPLAMFPAIHAPMQSFKSANHPHGAPLPTGFSAPPLALPPLPYNSGSSIPFVKLSQTDPAVQTIPTASVRFVPCLCGSGKEERWLNKATSSYAGSVPSFAAGQASSSFQPVQLLPCYCPLVRDIEPSQYVQSSPEPNLSGVVVESSSNNNDATPTEPALKS